MKTSKWAKQFAEIIRAEPRVLDLLGEAARVDASGKHWCANAFFYDKIKPRLTDLIGWFRGHKDGPAVCRLRLTARQKSPLGIVNMLEWSRAQEEDDKVKKPIPEREKHLHSSDAYDLVYDLIYTTLPDCKGCGCMR